MFAVFEPLNEPVNVGITLNAVCVWDEVTFVNKGVMFTPYTVAPTVVDWEIECDTKNADCDGDKDKLPDNVVLPFTINEPDIVSFPMNVLEPVVAIEALQALIDEVNVFNEINAAVLEVNAFNDAVADAMPVNKEA